MSQVYSINMYSETTVVVNSVVCGAVSIGLTLRLHATLEVTRHG